MTVAYLANQYPKVSHTFIRREIDALERLGLQIERYSVRRVDEVLADALDVAEAQRTRFILDEGKKGLAAALGRVSVESPLAFGRALALAERLGFRSDRGLARHMAYLGEACLLLEWLRKSGCTHVHAHFGTNATAVAMLCRELGGPPYSFTAHGPEEFDKPGPIGLAEKISRAKFVCGVSSFGRSQLYRHCPHGEWTKVHVVHCGLDASFLDAETSPVPRARRLACVGRLSEQKGQLLLVEAAAQLPRDFELHLVGDGELRKPIEDAIRRHGLEKNVFITGWADNAEVQARLRSSRALVLPSFAEGLPVVIMEALALGRPALSTYIAGIPELVTPDCGWLIPAGSVGDLAEAMRVVLDADPEALTKMGAIGRERARTRHDAKKSAEVLAALFRSG